MSAKAPIPSAPAAKAALPQPAALPDQADLPEQAAAPNQAAAPAPLAAAILPKDSRLRLRLYLGQNPAASLMLGPGKAELMEGIAETGSIAAAGRRMAMSYKRAWMLVEELNAAFRAPLVASARGGAGGGGAHLTALGQEVLARYRSVEAAAMQAAAPHLVALLALRAAPPQDLPDVVAADQPPL